MGILQQRPQHVTEHPAAGRPGGQLGDRPVVGRDVVAADRRVEGLVDGADEVTGRVVPGTTTRPLPITLTLVTCEMGMLASTGLKWSISCWFR